MKKTKVLLSMLLCLVLLFGVFPATVSAAAGDTLDTLSGATLLEGVPTSYQHLRDLQEGTVTKQEGESGFYQRLPRLTNICTTCGDVAVEVIPDTYSVSSSSSYTLSNPDVISDCSFSLEPSQIAGYAGYPCLQFNYTAKNPGTTTVELTFYYNYNYEGDFGRCGTCGALLQIPGNTTWYEETATFTVTVPEKERYTVTYTDGVDGEVVFADQVYDNLLSGTDTPDFVGTLEREGYVFAGWNPAVAETVTGSATYTATWKEDKNNNGQADEDEAKYTVTYTDGVDGEAVFADQVYDNLLSGTDTPDFVGTPEREGYVFAGWNPAVAETVTGSVTYTATWNRLPSEGETLPPDNPNDDVETIPDQDENSNVTAPDTGDYTVTWISFTLILAASVLLLLVKIRSNKAK